jgi:hypothetical protein
MDNACDSGGKRDGFKAKRQISGDDKGIERASTISQERHRKCCEPGAKIKPMCDVEPKPGLSMKRR